MITHPACPHIPHVHVSPMSKYPPCPCIPPCPSIPRSYRTGIMTVLRSYCTGIIPYRDHTVLGSYCTGIITVCIPCDHLSPMITHPPCPHIPHVHVSSMSKYPPCPCIPPCPSIPRSYCTGKIALTGIIPISLHATVLLPGRSIMQSFVGKRLLLWVDWY